jgi:hypothetical protein
MRLDGSTVAICHLCLRAVRCLWQTAGQSRGGPSKRISRMPCRCRGPRSSTRTCRPGGVPARTDPGVGLMRPTASPTIVPDLTGIGNPGSLLLPLGAGPPLFVYRVMQTTRTFSTMMDRTSVYGAMISVGFCFYMMAWMRVWRPHCIHPSLRQGTLQTVFLPP